MDIKVHHIVLHAVMLALFCSWVGCSKKPEGKSATQIVKTKHSNNGPTISQKPLPDFQVKLLELAFETASSIPVKPFIKDRSLAQEKVVDTCLELDQPVRAVRYADKIENWRRGLCYAKTAVYLAQNGYGAEQILKGLDIAEQIAAMDHGQLWRNDLIKAKIARAYVLLGEPEKAKQFDNNIMDSGGDQTKETESASNNHISFEEQIKVIDAMPPLMDFELTKAALHAYAGLYDFYYDDIEKRDILEDRIRSTCDKNKLPIPIQMELLMKLTQISLDHDDLTKALEMVNDTETYLRDYQWPIEEYIPLSANVAKLRFDAGDQEKARTDIDALLAFYDEKMDDIVDIYLAETICPLAEVYQYMGDTKMALSVYKKTVEASITNPNHKPQAEDLSATCCSMAVYAIEPDAELWRCIHEVREGLDGQ